MDETADEELFTNSMTRIYRRNDEVLKTIKLCGSSSNINSKRRKLLSEIEILETLNHVNVIKFNHAQITPINAIISLEYANMGDLSFYEPDDLDNFIFQLMNGVKYIHDNLILHRDIKPHNILIKNGIPKIADFDLSIKLSSKNQKIKGKAGTLRFMSPEALSGSYQSLKSDIWSFGITIYYLISKTNRYLNDINMENFREYLKHPAIEIPDVPFKDIIEKMIVVHPFFRYDIDDIFNDVIKPDFETYKDKYQKNETCVRYVTNDIAISEQQLQPYSNIVDRIHFEVAMSTIYYDIPEEFNNLERNISSNLLIKNGYFYISLNIF